MSFVGLIVSVFLWGALHSLLASHKAKGAARKAFGPVANRYYRLAYNLFAGLSFLPVLALAVLLPDRRLYLAPLPWSALMVFGQGLAAVALLIGFRQMDIAEFIGWRQWTAGQKDASSDYPLATQRGKLVVNGLYRYVRHPLYTAGLAFIWLMPLMTVNILAINIGLTVYVVIGAHVEECKLRQEFGDEYRNYMAVTPMFVPFLKRSSLCRKSKQLC